MNNEPVAWINKHGEISIEEHWAYPTPLYTHPVEEEHFEDEPQAEELHEIMQSNAELTDEEIGEMMGLDLAMQSSAYMNIVNKVKAILRKAQKNSNIFCKHGYDMSKCKCPKCETGIY